jgi:multicomponent Na+:H+ antiporter subunit G
MIAIREIIAIIAFGLATVFGIFGAIGLFRFPDPYSRLQAGALAGTTAVVSVFIGALALAPTMAIAARIVVIIIFFLISSPTGAHLVARFAWNSDIEPWKPQIVNKVRSQHQEPPQPENEPIDPHQPPIPKGNLLRATLLAERAKEHHREESHREELYKEESQSAPHHSAENQKAEHQTATSQQAETKNQTGSNISGGEPSEEEDTQ